MTDRCRENHNPPILAEREKMSTSLHNTRKRPLCSIPKYVVESKKTNIVQTMGTNRNFVDYYSLMLKINRENVVMYFDMYLHFLEEKGIIPHDEFTQLNNKESKRIFIELLIIALTEKMSEVTINGNITDKLSDIKEIWKNTFLKLEERISRTEILTASEEKGIDCIVKILQPTEIIRLCYEINKEVVNAPYRMCHYIPKPTLLEEGIHSIEEKSFLGPLSKELEEVNFFT